MEAVEARWWMIGRSEAGSRRFFRRVRRENLAAGRFGCPEADSRQFSRLSVGREGVAAGGSGEAGEEAVDAVRKLRI